MAKKIINTVNFNLKLIDTDFKEFYQWFYSNKNAYIKALNKAYSQLMIESELISRIKDLDDTRNHEIELLLLKKVKHEENIKNYNATKNKDNNNSSKIKKELDAINKIDLSSEHIQNRIQCILKIIINAYKHWFNKDNVGSRFNSPRLHKMI